MDIPCRKFLDKKNRVVITIDEEDWDKVRKGKWSYRGGYIYGTINGQKLLALHHFLCPPPKGMIVDHINRDPLDNRKKNLRICNIQGNIQNRGLFKNNKCRTTGVCFKQREQKYVATISINGKPKQLGIFHTLREAKIAYLKAKLKLIE